VSSSTEKVVYDLFSDASIDSTRWSTSGRVTEADGRLYLIASEGGDQTTDATASTDNKIGDPIYGFSADISWDGNRGSDSNMYIQITDGTNYIRFSMTHTPDKTHLILGGSYGSGEVAVWDNNGSVEVKQNGSNIEIYGQGILRYTITGDSIEANSYLYVIGGANGGGGETIKFVLDNVYIYESILTNEDLNIEIQTNSGGNPSGTPVTNGSIVVPASEIGSSFAELIKEFSTEPSLTSGTTYHLVIYQDGGDLDNYYAVKINSTDVLASSNLETSTDSGSSWTQVTAKDMYFKIWSTLPSSFELELIIKYFKSFFNVA
jgi:hypothetical protein